MTSSTTPTVPYTAGTYAEHFPMTALVHGLTPHLPTDVAALEARVRRETMAAEDVLHDMGAVPIINSDSQGMGRIGEVVTRTWQLAHKMKRERDSPDSYDDNERILQYLAKITINPAITHGVSDYVGSLEKGKMADIVLWDPRFFGVKPETIIKGGFVTWGTRGEGNASISNCEPVVYGPAFGAMGRAAGRVSVFFVSQASVDNGLSKKLGSSKKLLPVRNVRSASKRKMVRNKLNPDIDIDPRTSRVLVDGREAVSEAVKQVPLNRLYVIT